MSDEDEYTLEQQIRLLEQDYSLLNETLEELRQKLSQTATAAKPELEQKIADTQQEIAEVQQRLEALKVEAGLTAEPTKAQAPGQLHGVPNLPTGFIEHQTVLLELKAKLVMKPSLSDESEGQKAPLLLQAGSGMGKSVAAAFLAREDAVRRTFTGGIFWISLGHEPDIIAHQIRLTEALGDYAEGFATPEEGNAYLKKLCLHSACLFVLDDVWDVRDVMAFNGLGVRCQLLVTTCDDGLLDFIKHFVPSVQGYALQPFNDEAAALQFISHCCGASLGTMPASMQLALKQAGFAPAVLKLIASLVKIQQFSTWEAVHEHLEAAICDEYSDEYPVVMMQAMQQAVTDLGDEAEYYLALAVFADYTHIPQRTVYMLWDYLYQLRADLADKFLQRLASLGLLSIEGKLPHGILRINVFQHDFICTDAELEKLHDHLLAAYRRQCGQHGWAKGPNDGYFFEYLCMHLHQAGRLAELKALLLDFDWINTKLQTNTIHSILNDYEYLEDQDTDLVKDTLQQALPILLKDKALLAEQLLSYLSTKPATDIQKLLNQAKEVSTA